MVDWVCAPCAQGEASYIRYKSVSTYSWVQKSPGLKFCLFCDSFTNPCWDLNTLDLREMELQTKPLNGLQLGKRLWFDVVNIGIVSRVFWLNKAEMLFENILYLQSFIIYVALLEWIEDFKTLCNLYAIVALSQLGRNSFTHRKTKKESWQGKLITSSDKVCCEALKYYSPPNIHPK